MYLGPDLNRHGPYSPRDFKSLMSTISSPRHGTNIHKNNSEVYFYFYNFKLFMNMLRR